MVVGETRAYLRKKFPIMYCQLTSDEDGMHVTLYADAAKSYYLKRFVVEDTVNRWTEYCISHDVSDQLSVQ